MAIKRTYTRKEVEGLIGALEKQARDAMRLAKLAEEEAAKDSFQAYNEFRNKVGEFRALCILIEGRLKSVEAVRVDDLREEYARLDTLMLGLLVRASMRFFFVLSAKTMLPMGARDIFVSELHSLYDAAEKLRRPEYQKQLGDKLKGDLDTAEMILEEIIDKAPSLLKFG
ncbi:hypothetical protein GE253_00540 [Niveispirillum sp. SYP-B3756]|uniref:hypothetical protein n=1 Tax=unclassified Niveispirillum TaxID=2649257 RepID=UPI001292992E|nr:MULTISPECIES: hypothetical protein [unclassified Niveispirillum]MDG5495113.1 hypothetical protein [Niveispirillum sp. BGYR6]MQP63824.1 hypothetical protein [Niveispirillum sp. SYP-B3756]